MFLSHYKLKLTIHAYNLNVRFNYANLREYIHHFLVDSLVEITLKIII